MLFRGDPHPAVFDADTLSGEWRLADRLDLLSALTQAIVSAYSTRSSGKSKPQKTDRLDGRAGHA